MNFTVFIINYFTFNLFLVLKNIFHKNTEQAVAITEHIHKKGKGVVGTYLYEIAEQKGIETTLLAREEGYPLQVKVQRQK